MSAIEELKQLLDDRGVEWDDLNVDDAISFYHPNLGSLWVCYENNDRLDMYMNEYARCKPADLVNLLFGKRSKAIIVSNGITGTCRCESCGNTIDPWDRYCKHCGARLEVER